MIFFVSNGVVFTLMGCFIIRVFLNSFPLHMHELYGLYKKILMLNLIFFTFLVFYSFHCIVSYGLFNLFLLLSSIITLIIVIFLFFSLYCLNKKIDKFEKFFRIEVVLLMVVILNLLLTSESSMLERLITVIGYCYYSFKYVRCIKKELK